MKSVAQKIAIRNAIIARANSDDQPAEKAPRNKGFDLDAIISGDASRSMMRRFLKSIEGMDDDLMSVDQSRAAYAAEQALAPKVQDTAPFRASFEFKRVVSKVTKGDQPVNYLVMRGCEITTPTGETVERTVMAFGTAYDRVLEQVLAARAIDVEVAFSGSVLKVVEDAPALAA